MDLAADFDVTDLTFPVRTRFIDCPLIRYDSEFAYALHMAISSSWKKAPRCNVFSRDFRGLGIIEGDRVSSHGRMYGIMPYTV